MIFNQKIEIQNSYCDEKINKINAIKNLNNKLPKDTTNHKFLLSK